MSQSQVVVRIKVPPALQAWLQEGLSACPVCGDLWGFHLDEPHARARERIDPQLTWPSNTATRKAMHTQPAVPLEPNINE